MFFCCSGDFATLISRRAWREAGGSALFASLAEFDPSCLIQLT